MIDPRDYQIMAIEKGLASLEKGVPEIIMAPTGTGKSILVSGMCHQLKEPVLILQPSKEILEQNYGKLQQYGVEDICMYSASMNSKEICQYTYATIGSIKDYNLFKHFRYAIIDECHLFNSKTGMYKTFFKTLPKIKTIGLTATPYRMVQKFYQERGQMYYTSMLQLLPNIYPPFFKGFSFKITNKTMFEKGWLAPIDYKTQKDIDISRLRVNTTGADFDERVLEDYLNSPENVTKVVEAIMAEDEYTINNLIFCSSIRHAHNVAELLAKFGYDSDFVSAKTPEKQRENIIKRFKQGKIKRLINVGVLALGFDYPGLYTVTLARPTMSLNILYQQVGRCIRPDTINPNKRATVIDLCNNIRRLGTIESIRITKDLTGKDQVETDRGIISGRPLFNFRVTNQTTINRLT